MRVLVLAEYLPSPPGGPTLYINVEALQFFGDLWFLGLDLIPYELCLLQQALAQFLVVLGSLMSGHLFWYSRLTGI